MKKYPFTRRKVLDALGGATAAARFFKIKRTAVYQWGRNIPRSRQYELMIRRPDLFPPEPPEAPQ